MTALTIWLLLALVVSTAESYNQYVRLQRYSGTNCKEVQRAWPPAEAIDNA